METQTVEAVTSPAAMEASRGPVVNMSPEQRTEWRKTGNLPEPPKTEAPAASTEEPQETIAKVDTEAKPEPTKPQEKRRPDAEQRIKQLTDRIKELESRKPETAEAPKPVAKVEPQYTRPKPTAEDKDGDKPKYATYEDFVEDLADWKGEQRDAARQREQQETAQKTAMDSKMTDARKRYGDKFDEVLTPTIDAIMGKESGVHGVVKTMLNESEVLPDLIYTIGGDAKEMANFLKMAKDNPGKAMRYIALTESLIREELEGAEAPKETTPPVKVQTQAPRPPAEVGGRAATPGDSLEAAAKAGDFRSFKAEATRRHLAKMKG